jgi:hypothetical protein
VCVCVCVLCIFSNKNEGLLFDETEQNAFLDDWKFFAFWHILNLRFNDVHCNLCVEVEKHCYSLSIKIDLKKHHFYFNRRGFQYFSPMASFGDLIEN